MGLPKWLFDRETSRRDLLKSLALAALPVDLASMGAAKSGFRTIRLQTEAIEPVREFYASTLGLPTRIEGSELRVVAGRTELVFSKSESGRPYYHFAFNIPENKIEAARDWLKKRTDVVKRPGSGEEIVHFENWNAHAVYFFDPGGNIVEFIARHTLPNASKGPFSQREVLYASELGWVVEDVDAAVRRIQAGLGMKAYRPPGPDFAAMGDEHGLLIVVKKGRTWFGTSNLAAARFPSEAEVALLKAGSVADDLVKIRGIG